MQPSHDKRFTLLQASQCYKKGHNTAGPHAKGSSSILQIGSSSILQLSHAKGSGGGIKICNLREGKGCQAAIMCLLCKPENLPVFKEPVRGNSVHFMLQEYGGGPDAAYVYSTRGMSWKQWYAFCSERGARLCTFRHVCPDGHGKEPLRGYEPDGTHSWLPIFGHFGAANEWVNLQKNYLPCNSYTASHKGEHPAWGEQENNAHGKTIMCCKKPMFALPEYKKIGTQEKVITQYSKQVKGYANGFSAICTVWE